MSEFDQFWQKFPRRVGKLDAMKAFDKARKMASLAEILEGIDVYVANKPEYADYCHPSTWLNKGRWLDEPDQRTKPSEQQRQNWGFDCPHEQLCRSHWDCIQLRKKVG